MAEIIDLTVSPQREFIEISSDQANTPASRHNQTPVDKKQKRKKRKTPNGLSSDGPANSSTQPSRAHSQEDDNELYILTPRPPPTADEPGVFFVDYTASPIAGDNRRSEPGQSNGDDSGLLLPSHVTIFQGNGLSSSSLIPSPKPSSDDEQYIEYLDYEDRKGPGLIRYFEAEEQASQSRSSIFKCKNCGAEGEHKTYDCPVLICLTCGARDEHSTRSCPISKTCYTCGMKGHINKTCPNRFSAHTASSEFHGDCDRCGSTEHKANECPTLWRIYQYVNEEERILIMQSREQRKRLAIGDGGEGYIGREMWCYNCANTGHLGDDCDQLPHPADFPTEYAAFSLHNVMSGPFYDPATEPASFKRERKEDGGRLPNGWEDSALVDVGKRGKNKDKERLEKRFREQEDEGEDWFNDIRNAKKMGMDRRAPSRGRRLKFGMFKDGSHERFSPPPSLPNNGGRSLLARIGDAPGGKKRGKFDSRERREPSQQFENSIRIRGAASSQRSPEGGSVQESGDKAGGHRGSRRTHGPRYKGGYDR